VLSSEHTNTYKTEKVEAGSGKILKEAERFDKISLNGSEQFYPESEAEAKNPKSEKANSEA